MHNDVEGKGKIVQNRRLLLFFFVFVIVFISDSYASSKATPPSIRMTNRTGDIIDMPYNQAMKEINNPEQRYVISTNEEIYKKNMENLYGTSGQQFFTVFESVYDSFTIGIFHHILNEVATNKLAKQYKDAFLARKEENPFANFIGLLIGALLLIGLIRTLYFFTKRNMPSIKFFIGILCVIIFITNAMNDSEMSIAYTLIIFYQVFLILMKITTNKLSYFWKFFLLSQNSAHSPNSDTEATIESKLRFLKHLNGLYKQGLISKVEYEQKRSETIIWLKGRVNDISGL